MLFLNHIAPILSTLITIGSFTLIPINIHFNCQGFAKIELGISKGRKKSDLREYKKQQDWKREKERLAKKT